MGSPGNAGNPGKGPVRRSLAKVTGLAGAQPTRLTGRHRKTVRIEDQRGGAPACPFGWRCTGADIRLLAAVDAATCQMPGPATRAPMRRRSSDGGLHGGDEGGGGRRPRGDADATRTGLREPLRRGAAGFAGEESAGRREARAGRALRPARDSCRARQRLRMMRTSSSSVRIWRMICRLWLTSSFASSPESR